ncbi:FAR1 Cyclin-dependent kinase inhibitor FAR1 [Candida maltosa Xu316]
MTKHSSLISKLYSPTPSIFRRSIAEEYSNNVIEQSAPPFSSSSPVETKNLSDEKCVFCHDLLSWILPGEEIAQLDCNHRCHKNCLSLVGSAPICRECAPSPDISLEPPYTPVEQVCPSFVVNSQLETPSALTNQPQYDIYKPRITCLNETTEITLGADNEVAYVFNVKAPQAYNKSDNNLTLAEFELKQQVQRFLVDYLDIMSDAGELIVFDMLEISVDGSSWDQTMACLFEEYLFFYDHESLVGMVAIKQDISSLSRSDNVIVFDLAKEALPELHMRHSHEVVVTKWERLLNKLIDGDEDTTTNLHQLTNTCWTTMEEYFDIPPHLIKLEHTVKANADIPNSFMSKILPHPKNLPFNLVVAVPLVNHQSSLTDEEYKHELQSAIMAIWQSLRPKDKLALIFVGVDSFRRPNASATFVGCVDADWSGWESLISEIEIVPNSFNSNQHEINTAIAKCVEMYPFIPVSDMSVNKFLILNTSCYDDDKPSDAEVLSSKIEQLNQTLSCTLVRIGETYNGSQFFTSPSTTFDTSVLRYNTMSDFTRSVTPLIKECFHVICIPDLEIELRTNKDMQFSKLDITDIDNDTTRLVLHIKDIAPNTETNIFVAIKCCQPNEFSRFIPTPVLEYNATWFDEQELGRKVVKTKIKSGIVHRPSSPVESKSTNDTTSYIDIPLLPPLSPTREAPFVKRQIELAVVTSLQQALMANINEIPEIMNNCMSIVHGLARGISSQTLANDMAITSKTHHYNIDEYVSYLVNQMMLIIKSCSVTGTQAKTKCLDMMYRLV